MSRHGKNCQAKARKNARLKKWWIRCYGRRNFSRRWNAPAASSILAQRKKHYELYGNQANKVRRK